MGVSVSVRRGFRPSRLPAFQELQQRHVGFRDGLEQPVLFQELLVLRVPDKRQVRVEDEGQVTGHGGKV